MVYKNNLTKYLISLVFISSTLFAQLELSVYTDKDTYQYGEQIDIFCKVTNTADTTFKFFASTFQSCQAEFSFNDFNSWEHTACLATMELLTFKPHKSKIYSWKIEPSESGLPNNDGTQMIIGKYYFGLLDTIYINAPQFLGGQLNVNFLPGNADSLQSLKDSLNVTVLDHFDNGTIISEFWQIEGFQIDSVINYFQKNSLLSYIENAVFVQYDKIENENPLDFYPLHVGDKWQYFVEEKQIGEENETSRYIEINVVGKDTIDDKSYFILTNSENYCLQYLRIDSSDATIWELKDGSECMIDSLTMLPNSKGFINQCFGSSECISDTTKVIFNQERDVKKFYYTDGTTCTFCTRGYYEYAENIGKTIKHIIHPAPEGFESGYKIDSLVYAKVGGVEYGTFVSPRINEDVNYYPLQNGNYFEYISRSWEFPYYDETSYNSIEILGDTLLVNGKTYKIVLSKDILKNSVRYKNYERIDSSTGAVYMYSPDINYENPEYIIDSLSAQIGDTIISSRDNSEYFKKIVTDIRVDSVFGILTEVKSFFDISYIPGYQYEIARGFGFWSAYNCEFGCGSSQLVYAIIDGKEYGIKTDIKNFNNNLPIKFSLSQNYPNPFNPSTTIKYSIPSNVKSETSNTKLVIFDILGREVATLVNKEQKPGNYEIQFEASGLTSGIYFYKLQSGSFVASRKMILLK